MCRLDCSGRHLCGAAGWFLLNAMLIVAPNATAFYRYVIPAREGILYSGWISLLVTLSPIVTGPNSRLCQWEAQRHKQNSSRCSTRWKPQYRLA